MNFNDNSGFSNLEQTFSIQSNGNPNIFMGGFQDQQAQGPLFNQYFISQPQASVAPPQHYNIGPTLPKFSWTQHGNQDFQSNNIPNYSPFANNGSFIETTPRFDFANATSIPPSVSSTPFASHILVPPPPPLRSQSGEQELSSVELSIESMDSRLKMKQQQQQNSQNEMSYNNNNNNNNNNNGNNNNTHNGNNIMTNYNSSMNNNNNNSNNNRNNNNNNNNGNNVGNVSAMYSTLQRHRSIQEQTKLIDMAKVYESDIIRRREAALVDTVNQAMRFLCNSSEQAFKFQFSQDTIDDFLSNLDKFDFMQPAGNEKSIKDWFKAGKSKWMPPIFVEAFVANDVYAVKIGALTQIPAKTIIAECYCALFEARFDGPDPKGKGKLLITRGVFNPRRHNVFALHLTKVAKEHFNEKYLIHKKKYPNPKKVRTPHFKLDFWKDLFEDARRECKEQLNGLSRQPTPKAESPESRKEDTVMKGEQSQTQTQAHSASPVEMQAQGQVQQVQVQLQLQSQQPKSDSQSTQGMVNMTNSPATTASTDSSLPRSHGTSSSQGSSDNGMISIELPMCVASAVSTSNSVIPRTTIASTRSTIASVSVAEDPKLRQMKQEMHSICLSDIARSGQMNQTGLHLNLQNLNSLCSKSVSKVSNNACLQSNETRTHSKLKRRIVNDPKIPRIVPRGQCATNTTINTFSTLPTLPQLPLFVSKVETQMGQQVVQGNEQHMQQLQQMHQMQQQQLQKNNFFGLPNQNQFQNLNFHQNQANFQNQLQNQSVTMVSPTSTLMSFDAFSNFHNNFGSQLSMPNTNLNGFGNVNNHGFDENSTFATSVATHEQNNSNNMSVNSSSNSVSTNNNGSVNCNIPSIDNGNNIVNGIPPALGGGVFNMCQYDNNNNNHNNNGNSNYNNNNF